MDMPHFVYSFASDVLCLLSPFTLSPVPPDVYIVPPDVYIPAYSCYCWLLVWIFCALRNPSHFLKNSSESCVIHTYNPDFFLIFTSKLLKRVFCFLPLFFTFHFFPNPLQSAFCHHQCTAKETCAWVITYLVKAQTRGFLCVLWEHLAHFLTSSTLFALVSLHVSAFTSLLPFLLGELFLIGKGPPQMSSPLRISCFLLYVHVAAVAIVLYL